MAIPESQLDVWAAQGSVSQSASTYASVKRVLESTNAPYSQESFDVFLQGSYGNDTNVYSDSDVDVVIRTGSVYYYDLAPLNDAEQALFHQQTTSATYELADFKRDVKSQLRDAFGSAVKPGSKAILITADGNRRETDVLPCAEFRRYQRFRGWSDQSYVEGLCFFRSDGTQIINYPKQHSENCTIKHQDANQWFKPMVRILKNMRNRMVDTGVLADGIAPSYFLEGMFYNVPNDRFGGSFASTFVNSVTWLAETDRTQLVCANEQYYLLNETCPVTWRSADCLTFLNAVLKFWNAYDTQ
jgi:hypothetical protein